MENGSDRILLADSSEADYVFLHDMLELTGCNRFQLYRANSYEQAVGCIRAESWHMIFIDQHLDDHFGLELAHFARLWDSCVPIVLLCDSFSDQLDYQARKIGLFDCIEKGFITLTYLEGLLMHCQQHQEKAKRKTWSLLQYLIQPAS